MIDNTKITESNFKFHRPRIIAVMFWIVMIIWNFYFLLFYYNENANQYLLGIFQFFCMLIFSTTFVIGIILICLPNDKIYSFNHTENKFVIFERAAFTNLYKILQCNSLQSVKEAVVEEKKDGYECHLFLNQDHNKTLISSAKYTKIYLQRNANAINDVLSGKAENTEVRSSDNKYLENTYIILIIIQIFIYSEIIRQLLLSLI